GRLGQPLALEVAGSIEADARVLVLRSDGRAVARGVVQLPGGRAVQFGGVGKPVPQVGGTGAEAGQADAIAGAGIPGDVVVEPGHRVSVAVVVPEDGGAVGGVGNGGYEDHLRVGAADGQVVADLHVRRGGDRH